MDPSVRSRFRQRTIYFYFVSVRTRETSNDYTCQINCLSFYVLTFSHVGTNGPIQVNVCSARLTLDENIQFLMEIFYCYFEQNEIVLVKIQEFRRYH